MAQNDDHVNRLEMELGVVRTRLKAEQAERLQLWPKAELADKYLVLLRRSRDVVRRMRKSLVGAELKTADLLLADIARLIDVVSGRDERSKQGNQPCFACGATEGATTSREGPYARCNVCGYAG